jgi:putative ABC transport system permease protein
MSYSLMTLWHERRRFLPAVLAVAFSALLVALQCGLLLGTFSIVSIPVDHTGAHVWVGCPEVISVDVTRPVPGRWQSRLALPEVERTEPYYQGFGSWRKPAGAAELAIIIGSRLGEDALGKVRELAPELCLRLSEPGAVVVDEADRERLGITGVGARAEVNGQAVRVVGLVRGLKGLAGPYVFCSLETARSLMKLDEDQATYLLARCRDGADAGAVVRRLREAYPGEMAVFTSAEFSRRSRWHWLINTGAGISLLCAAVLGLLVGAVITSQTLYAATAASQREFAVLRALGIPRRRMAAGVLWQSLCVGVAGVAGALPAVWLLAAVAVRLGAMAYLPPELLAFASTLTLLMALGSGLFALRSLRKTEPALLLR